MDHVIGADLSHSLSTRYLNKGQREGTRVETVEESEEAIAKVIQLALTSHIILIHTLGTCLPMLRVRKGW
jgi:hypothetical protein